MQTMIINIGNDNDTRDDKNHDIHNINTNIGTALCCTVLYYTILYYAMTRYVTLCYTMRYTILYYIILYYITNSESNAVMIIIMLIPLVILMVY